MSITVKGKKFKSQCYQRQATGSRKANNPKHELGYILDEGKLLVHYCRQMLLGAIHLGSLEMVVPYYQAKWLG